MFSRLFDLINYCVILHFLNCIYTMPHTPAPIFRHGKLLVDSSGFDASLRPKYDFVLQEIAKADAVSLLHANLRTGIEDRWLVLEPHCFEFDFQFTMKNFRTCEL